MPEKAGCRKIEADKIINGDCAFVLKEMQDESVHCCVTSPPYYGLRDYGIEGQVGREETPEQYIRKLTEIFAEVYRVLKPDGTCWLNISDTYCGTGSKGTCTDPKNPEGRNGQKVSIAQNVEAVADLSEFWGGEKEIKLLDANILACPDWERLLGQLEDSRADVDFTQGLDVRLITPEKVAALNKINTKMLHFAWDNPEDDLTPYFKKFSELTTVKDKRKRRVYVLTNYGSTHEQDLYRIYTLRDMGYDPYVMVYEKPTAPEETRKMQRWVNNKWLFYSVKDFKDYDPKGYRKGQALDNR